MGKVGLLIYFDSSLTHSLSTSSRWIISIVAIAWIGSTISYFALFAMGSPTYNKGMLNQFTTLLSNTYPSDIPNRPKCSDMCSGCTSQFSGYYMEVGQSISLPECFSDDTHDITGHGKLIFHMFHHLLTRAG